MNTREQRVAYHISPQGEALREGDLALLELLVVRVDALLVVLEDLEALLLLLRGLVLPVVLDLAGQEGVRGVNNLQIFCTPLI